MPPKRPQRDKPIPAIPAANIEALRRHLERLKQEFQRKADDFRYIMLFGGGIQNIHIGQTLTELNNLFSSVVAANNALCVVEKGYL